jgi:hypothetical protein
LLKEMLQSQLIPDYEALPFPPVEEAAKDIK